MTSTNLNVWVKFPANCESLSNKNTVNLIMQSLYAVRSELSSLIFGIAKRLEYRL